MTAGAAIISQRGIIGDVHHDGIARCRWAVQVHFMGIGNKHDMRNSYDALVRRDGWHGAHCRGLLSVAVSTVDSCRFNLVAREVLASPSTILSSVVSD